MELRVEWRVQVQIKLSQILIRDSKWQKGKKKEKGDLISVENSGYVVSPSVKIGSSLVCGY